MAIFVEENHGEEYSEIHSLKIFGEAVMGTNVSNIKGITCFPSSADPCTRYILHQ